MNEWFAGAVKKLMEVHWYAWAIVAALLAAGVALLASGRKKQNWSSRQLAVAAMCIALSFVLSGIRLYRVPQGGSVTPLSMLPLIAFALAYGPAAGALAGCAYGLLQLIQDPYVIHPVQLLLDYPLAFGALALGAIARYLPLPKWSKLPLAVVLASLGRYAMAVLSGMIFFASNAPVGQSVLWYSLGYNLTYLGPDALLCFAMAFVPGIVRAVDLMEREHP